MLTQGQAKCHRHQATSQQSEREGASSNGKWNLPPLQHGDVHATMAPSLLYLLRTLDLGGSQEGVRSHSNLQMCSLLLSHHIYNKN